MTIGAWILFGLGAFLSLLNFYVSFLRYLLFRLWGGEAAEYHWMSGFPVAGSLALILAAFVFLAQGIAWAAWLSLALAAMDTGGLHWFCLSLGWQRFLHSENR